MFYSLPEDIQWYIMEKVRKMEIKERYNEAFTANIKQGYKAFVEKRKEYYSSLYINKDKEYHELLQFVCSFMYRTLEMGYEPPNKCLYEGDKRIFKWALIGILMWYNRESCVLCDGCAKVTSDGCRCKQS